MNSRRAASSKGRKRAKKQEKEEKEESNLDLNVKNSEEESADKDDKVFLTGINIDTEHKDEVIENKIPIQEEDNTNEELVANKDNQIVERSPK